MSLAARAALDALVTMVGGIAGVQATYKGAPESLSNRVSAYVALGAQPQGQKAGGLLERNGEMLVVFGYRVKGAEATAEETLADFIDAFTTQFYADRKNGAGLFDSATTQVQTGELDMTLARSPEYMALAGQEYRLFPIIVTATQRANN